MSTTSLAPSKAKEGRFIFNLFQAVTCFSFPLVNGSVITLYAIKLEASASLIGILASFNFLCFLISPLGKIAEAKIGAGRTFAITQMLRYVAMVPILVLPLLANGEKVDTLYIILTVSYFGFNFFRGISLVGQNPIIAMLAEGKERNRYLAVLMMINFLFTILSYLVLATILNLSNTSMLGYNIIIIIGLLTGFLSAYYLFKLPNTPISAKKTSILTVFNAARRRWPFKRFVISYFLASFVMGLSRPYIVVYTKQVYNQSDGNAILLTAIGTLGSLMMAALSRTIINLVGGKTLYIFFMVVASISLLPAIISPDIAGTTLLIFLSIFHFVSTFGMQGVESNAQTYLFTVIRKDEITDLSLVYYMIYGLAGALGSTITGFLLDFFPNQFNLNPTATFQVLFALILVGYLITLFFLTRLQNSSKHSVMDGLGFILSPKDIKAISLANQLESNIRPSEQIHLLEELSYNRSEAPTELLVETLNSPKLFVRRQALFTLESIAGTQDPVVIDALLTHVLDRPYTTGYMAARILGQNKIKRAIPYLRYALTTADDHYLTGEIIRALARLNDKVSIAPIYNLIKPNNNIYIVIQAINALELLLDQESFGQVLKPFRWPELKSDSVGNEAILSTSKLLNIEEWFYPLFTSYSKNPKEAFFAMQDLYESNKKRIGESSSLEILLENPKPLEFYKHATIMLNEKKLFFAESEAVQIQLQIAAANPVLFRHHKVRFLFIAFLLANYLERSNKYFKKKRKKEA